METVNYTKFRSNLKHWLDKVYDDVSDVIIKRKDGKDLVLVSLDEYNSMKETNYLLTGKNRDVLLNSIEELEAGKGIQNDLLEEWNWPGPVILGQIICIGKKRIKKSWKELINSSKIVSGRLLKELANRRL